MFALPGTIALVIFILTRPTDFSPALKGVPLLYVFVALALFGWLVDVRLGYIELARSPQLGWAVTFLVWCAVTMALAAPAELFDGVVTLAIVFVLFFLIAHGLQTFRGFEALAAVVLGSSLWIAAVCVHQGVQPFECVAVDASADHTSMGRPDGRPCENEEQCYVDPPEPQSVYRCERAGVFGITSIAEGRVRYLGVLHDPNEVALTCAVALPLAMGFYRRRRSRGRRLLVLGAALLVGTAIVMSKSRGGVLVFLAAVGVYFLERYRWKGAAFGAAVGAPLLVLGGRGGKAASASTIERLECWFEGMWMFQHHPILGVGFGQFTEHHHLTAHNSFVLAAAESGVLGVLTWSAVMYLSGKTALQARLRLTGEAAAVARDWGMALLASLAGLTVGVFFLSFNYHFVFWIYAGMAGALYAAIRRHDPDFRVRLGLWDLLGLSTVVLGLLVAIALYTRVALG